MRSTKTGDDPASIPPPQTQLPHLWTTRNGGVQELLNYQHDSRSQDPLCLAATLTTELNYSCFLTTIPSLTRATYKELVRPKILSIQDAGSSSTTPVRGQLLRLGQERRKLSGSQVCCCHARPRILYTGGQAVR